MLQAVSDRMNPERPKNPTIEEKFSIIHSYLQTHSHPQNRNSPDCESTIGNTEKIDYSIGIIVLLTIQESFKIQVSAGGHQR